jgi:hypothetical protein
MFEWGGGCLWCGDDVTRARFGVGPVERRLGLSDALVARLAELSGRHDRALDWDDPAGPSPWGEPEFDNFDADALAALERLRAELGEAFEVSYGELGRPG